MSFDVLVPKCSCCHTFSIENHRTPLGVHRFALTHYRFTKDNLYFCAEHIDFAVFFHYFDGSGVNSEPLWGDSGWLWVTLGSSLAYEAEFGSL